MTGKPSKSGAGKPIELAVDQVRTTVAVADSEEIRPDPLENPLELAPGAVRPNPIAVVAPPQAPPKPRRGLRRVCWWSLGLFAVGAMGWQVWDFLGAAFARSTSVGLGLSTLAGIAALSGGAILLREISGFGRGLRKLGEVESYAARAAALRSANGHGQALGFTTQVLEPYQARPEMTDRVAAFRGSVTTAHSDAQVLDILADTVIRPLDAQAYPIIARAARDSAVGVALSPFGLLDAGLVVWRTLRMVGDVATIYGFRPGFFGRVSLVKRILSAAATAGAGDFAADILVAQVGASVGGLLSAKAGEGVLTGMRTARLGLVTMAACRPLPFTEEDRASITRLGKQILKSPD